jgi:adenine phosphoribosyltransferase
MVIDATSVEELRRSIRSVPDFPKKGIVFRDITTLLSQEHLLKAAVSHLVRPYLSKGITKVACIEARGFILGGAMAVELGAGFVPVRKSGKLPSETVKEEYALEYGTDVMEVHRDAITRGERVLIHDDLLATGGTAAAACRLVRALGGEIAGLCFLIELSFLKGRERLKGYDVFSLIDYTSE